MSLYFLWCGSVQNMEGKRCFNSFLEIYLGFYVSSRKTTIRWKLKKQINKGQLRSNWYQNFSNLGAKLISKNHFGPYKPYWVYQKLLVNQFLMPNGTTSFIIYPPFDIHDNNQGREGLRGQLPLLSICGGKWGEGKEIFWRGGNVVAHPKKFCWIPI